MTPTTSPIGPTTVVPPSSPDPSSSTSTPTSLPLGTAVGNGSVWTRITDWWQGAHPLEEELTQLVAMTDGETPVDRVAQAGTAILRTLATHRGDRTYYKSELRFTAWVRSLNIAHLDAFFAAAAKVKANTGQNGLMDLVLEALPLDRMQELMAYRFREVEGIEKQLSDLRSLAANSTRFLPEGQTTLDAASQAVAHKTTGAFDAVFRFIQVFSDTFRRAHEFSLDDPPPQHSWEAKMRLRNLYELMEKPLQVLKWLVAVLTATIPRTWAGYLVAALVLIIGGLGMRFFDRWLNGTPQQLQFQFPNLTRQARRGELDPVLGRQQEVQRIIDCLGNLDKHSRHPLLVGISGVGKTEIIKGLAQEIESGRHPQLAGKSLFLINTAQLQEPGGGGMGPYQSRLEMILKEIRGKEDNVIFFFDEVHSLMNARSSAIPLGQNYSQQFKTLLDNPKIHCIAATTSEEYENLIQKDTALERRFRLVPVEPLSTDQCKLLLRDIAVRDFPEIEVSDEAIDLALRLTDADHLDVAQPSKAKDLLIESIQSVMQYRGPDRIDLAVALDALEAEKKRQAVTAKEFIFSNEAAAQRARLDVRQAEVDRLTRTVAQKNDQITQLHKLRSDQRTWKKRTAELTRKLGRLDAEDSSSRAAALGKAVLFLGGYLLPAYEPLLEEHVRTLQRDGLPTRVDSDVVSHIHATFKKA